MNYARTAIIAAIALLATPAMATWAPKPEEPKPAAPAGPVSSSSSATTGPTNSASNSGATSGSTSGATSGSASGASVGPVAGGSTGPVSLTTQGGPVSASNGPVTVAPSESNTTTHSTRALAISLPAPVFGGSPTAGNCLVAGNNAWAIGWNFGSKSDVRAFSDPVCTLRAAAIEAEASCQFLTAATIRAHLVSMVAPGLSVPVSSSARDLSPEQCLEARQPRIIQAPAAPQQTVVVSQEAGAAALAEVAPPPAAARPRKPAAPSKPCVTQKREIEVCVPEGGAK